MMVFRQKIGDSIRVSDNITIVILDIQDGRIVRFGIEAPPEIAVHRLEIYAQIQRENQAAVAGDALAWLNQGGKPCK